MTRHAITLLAMLTIAGCGKFLTKRSTEGVVDSIAEERNREQLAGVLTSPEARPALEAVGAGMAAGALEESGLGSDTPDRLARSFTAAVAEGVREDIAPAVAQGVREDIVPAIGDAVPVASALASQFVGDPAFRAAVGQLVHEMSRQAALGSEAAAQQIRLAREARGEVSAFAKLGQSEAAWVVMGALLGCLGFTVVLLAFALARSRRRIEDQRDRSTPIARVGTGARAPMFAGAEA